MLDLKNNILPKESGQRLLAVKNQNLERIDLRHNYIDAHTMKQVRGIILPKRERDKTWMGSVKKEIF